jgi:hypothetical protein
MKAFRCLVLMTVACAFASVANATPADFHMGVLDPPPPPSPSFPTNIITSTSFDVTFIPCVADELPGGLTADGCFAGANRSGVDWTQLQLTFTDTDALGDQGATCDTNPTFMSVGCPTPTGDAPYILTFSDGNGIPNNGSFFIYETGVPPGNFPDGSAVANSTVPEPAPWGLLLTGCILFGCLVNRERGLAIWSSLRS